MHCSVQVTPWSIGLMSALFLGAIPQQAIAQGWYADWGCHGPQCAAIMGGWTGTAPRDGSSFASLSDCEAWRRATILSSTCRYGGFPPGSSSPARHRGPRTLAGRLILAPVVGGALGALVGSVATSPDAKDQWANGALAGAGAMTVMVATLHAPRIPLIPGVALSGIGGAVVGTAVARYEIEQGKADETKEKAIGGAVAGGMSFVIGKMAGGSKFRRVPRLLGRTGRIAFLMTPRFAGVTLSW
jgi:hypothetical protein